MNSKRLGYIIIIAVLSTFLVIGSATARTMSYNTAYAAGVNASSAATGTIPTTQINPYTSAKILLQDGISALQQDNDTSKALTHLKLAYQQLTSVREKLLIDGSANKNSSTGRNIGFTAG
jgi:preprotein translocase subunit SecY